MREILKYFIFNVLFWKLKLILIHWVPQMYILHPSLTLRVLSFQIWSVAKVFVFVFVFLKISKILLQLSVVYFLEFSCFLEFTVKNTCTFFLHVLSCIYLLILILVITLSYLQVLSTVNTSFSLKAVFYNFHYVWLWIRITVE